jgi:hypothetical protein
VGGESLVMEVAEFFERASGETLHIEMGGVIEVGDGFRIGGGRVLRGIVRGSIRS